MNVADQVNNKFDVEGYRVFWVHVPVLEPIKGSHDRIHAIQFGAFRGRQGVVVLIDGDCMFEWDVFVLLVHPCGVVDD